MRKLSRRLFIASIFLACSALASAEQLKIVTTTPDLASLAQAVGGDLVTTSYLIQPNQDAEAFDPRPQDLKALQGARLVVRVGLDYDLWFDRLLREAGNPAIRRGGLGYVDASTGIALLEIRSAALTPVPGGHNHGMGNPHYWLDPANAEIITGSILDGLVRIDPKNAQAYAAHRAAFLARLKAKIGEWRRRLAQASEVPGIAYHNSWPYFARRFRLHIIGHIEVKPGIPPGPAYLAELMKTMKAKGARYIIKEPFEPDQVPHMLASRTGAKMVVLAPSVGAVREAKDYLSLFDYNVGALTAVLPGGSR